MQLYWRPQQLVLLAASLLLLALIYGGIGIMFAAFLRSELAAMFLLIMTSFIDLGLQNPIANTDAANPLLSVLPAYGAIQTAVTSIGLCLVPSSYVVFQDSFFATSHTKLGLTASDSTFMRMSYIARARTACPSMTCPGARALLGGRQFTTRYCPLRVVERDGGAVTSAG
jgi:hypothetical protein